MQSPVDLDAAVRGDLPVLELDYRPIDVSLFDSGTSIQAACTPGCVARVGGRVHRLVQFHFHTPAEHTIAGRRHPFCCHFVHAGPAGETLVVGVLFESGRHNDTLSDLWWWGLPDPGGEPREIRGLDPTGLLPPGRRYYGYTGSLTTPPFTEGVIWCVLEETVRAAGEQFAIFRQRYPQNARDPQPLAGRTILY